MSVENGGDLNGDVDVSIRAKIMGYPSFKELS